jgi:hypothetical protein
VDIRTHPEYPVRDPPDALTMSLALRLGIIGVIVAVLETYLASAFECLPSPDQERFD